VPRDACLKRHLQWPPIGAVWLREREPTMFYGTPTFINKLLTLQHPHKHNSHIPG